MKHQDAEGDIVQPLQRLAESDSRRRGQCLVLQGHPELPIRLYPIWYWVASRLTLVFCPFDLERLTLPCRKGLGSAALRGILAKHAHNRLVFPASLSQSDGIVNRTIVVS